MDETRDRIAEIIRNANMTANPLSQFGYAEADALLANGFILLPCKVGDKVYLSEWWNSNKWEKQPCPIERRVRYFSIDDDGIYAHLKDGCINVKYFGKTVFLTREEAEKALREKNNE